VRRSRLRRQSRTRAANETIPDVPRLLREQVLARALYRCEARCCDWCEDRGLQAHHRLRRQHSGPNTLENLVAVCPDCHAWIHAHPDRAYALGLLLHRYDGPPSEAWNAGNSAPGRLGSPHAD
jgi:5-methylcytosine-specific restriction endonuclease McrA